MCFTFAYALQSIARLTIDSSHDVGERVQDHTASISAWIAVPGHSAPSQMKMSGCMSEEHFPCWTSRQCARFPAACQHWTKPSTILEDSQIPGRGQ